MNISLEDYDLMLRDLFARHPSVQQVGFGAGAYKPGLDGMLRFDASLGHPWKKYRSIHIAGTNGKGSVSSMLAAALASTGMKVGLYTSPHLADFRERMKIISGRSSYMPDREFVCDFLKDNDTDGLSFFEITTGMAFSWFASQNADIAVIETGLGGRLDSTNIITPELSVITSIGLDHCALLGNTRSQIAGEKAGIFKKGIDALVSVRDPQTAPVFIRTADALPCPLHFSDEFEVHTFETDLKGPYQEVNLRTALAALQIIGVPADRDAMAHTAEITGFRGRWEKIFSTPETICDIGHNPDALRINFARLEQSGRPLFIVYGIMADKDIDTIRSLMPKKARYYIAAPAIPRALDTATLAEKMSGLDCTSCESVADAVEKAITDALKIPGALVYVGGSNYLVAECILHLDAIRQNTDAK